MRLPDTNKTPRTSASGVDCHPVGNFALFPSDTGSLLVKSVAVQELMMPYDTGNQLDEPTEDCLNMISDSLDQVWTL